MIEKITEMIAERTNSEFNDETKLTELGLDSLDFLELMVELDIPSEDIDELHTVGDIANYISNKIPS
jgi:acyl carrier protein